MSGNTTYFGIQYPSSSDYVKDGATAIQTVADGFDSAVAIPTYNAQTGTTYTFVLADTSKTVTASNAAASTYTIPPQSSVVWVAGTTLNEFRRGRCHVRRWIRCNGDQYRANIVTIPIRAINPNGFRCLDGCAD